MPGYEIVFKKIKSWLQSSYIKEKIFVAVVTRLLISIIKRCTERCALQLYHTSLTRGFKKNSQKYIPSYINTLSAKPKKWSNTLKQFVGSWPRIV